MIGNLVTGLIQRSLANKDLKKQAEQAAAYNKYVIGQREGIKDLYKEGEENFLQEANTPLPELGAMQSAVANQGTYAQQDLSKRLNAELAKQGVRGGQAGIISGRQMGKLGADLQKQITDYAFNEASNRQNARLQNLSQTGLLPLSSYVSPQWMALLKMQGF